MAILSASDLERISSSVAEKSPQNSVAQKRRSLKACSDERVCTWTDTLAAKRKSRLEWKDQKWKKEEEERMEVDRKEAALQENMRQAILENSRRQVFEQNDKVKWLRSHQLYIDVVEERAKQISLSRNIEKDRHQEELKWHKDTMKKVHMAELKESEEAATRKAKSIEIARDLKYQRQKAKEAEERQKKEDEEEGKYLKQIALDDLVIEQKKAIAKMEKIKRANASIVKQNQNLKRIYEENQRVEAKEAERLKKEEAELNRLALGRAQLEKRLFDERQEVRKKMIDKATADLTARSEREVEAFVLEQQKQNDATNAKIEREQKKREMLQKDIDKSRQIQIREGKQQLESERNDDEIFMKHFQKINEKLLLDEQRKQKKRYNQNKELRENQEKQMKENQERRQKEKAKEIHDHKEVSSYLKSP